MAQMMEAKTTPTGGAALLIQVTAPALLCHAGVAT